MFRSFRLAATAALLFSASAANALLIDFENGADPFFSTQSVMYTDSVGVGSGYDNVLDFTSSNGVAFNPSGAPLASFSQAAPGTFDLTSFVIAGAWGNQTLSIEGLVNGLVSFSQDLAVTTAAQLVSLDWMGIDSLQIRTDANGYVDTTPTFGAGQHWALDNVRVNESVGVAEPGVLALLLVGAAVLSTRKRKLAPVNN